MEIDGQKYTIYQATQLMRKLETEVRKQKDIANMAKISGDDVLRREAQAKIRDLNKKYTEVAQAAGLKERREKMEVESYSHTGSKLLGRIGLQFFAKPDISKVPTYYLPKNEYAHVMSELSTNLTDSEKMSNVYSKRIGKYMYIVENNGNLDFRVIGKKKYDSERGEYIDIRRKRTDR